MMRLYVVTARQTRIMQYTRMTSLELGMLYRGNVFHGTPTKNGWVRRLGGGNVYRGNVEEVV